jgi:hypothetical protein
MTNEITPNAPQGTATESSAVTSDASIAAKMAAMREHTERNQIRQQAEQPATGENESAETSTPVAPNDNIDAEVGDTNDNDNASDNLETDSPQEVTTDTNSTQDELIDFIEFSETNPNAKFKFMKNGKEVVIDAKKAAAILGQGSAIHEEARQLKIERAEFDEYLKGKQQEQEGLTLAMEFTIQPKLQRAYDEIVKTQGYQTTFHQQLAQTRDPAQIARIQASMQQNEVYIRQQQGLIGQIKPAVDQFKQIRANQVTERLDQARKSFTDKELKNEYVYNEVRNKVSKLWPQADLELIPGVKNIDLISSDEGLLSLVRDGLRYRDKPTTKSAGSSLAALTQKRGSSTQRGTNDDLGKLREQAKGGDKKAADNLLTQRLTQIRSARGGR